MPQPKGMLEQRGGRVWKITRIELKGRRKRGKEREQELYFFRYTDIAKGDKEGLRIVTG